MTTKRKDWRYWLQWGGEVVLGTFFVAFGLATLGVLLGVAHHVSQTHGMWIFYASVVAAMLLLAGVGCMLIPESKKEDADA